MTEKRPSGTAPLCLCNSRRTILRLTLSRASCARSHFNTERHRSRCLVSNHRNHSWNGVTPTVRASRVIGSCGATVKHPARQRAHVVCEHGGQVEQDDLGMPG